MYIKKIKLAQKKGKIVAVYANPESPDGCSVGYVKYVDKKLVILNAVSREGLNDGLVCRRTDLIIEVDMDGSYEKKIHDLHVKYGAIFPSISFPRLNSIGQVLNFAQENKIVVSIWMRSRSDSAYFNGLISSSTKGKVTLSKIDDFGRDNGVATISISSIECIDIGGIIEQQLMYLHEIGGDPGRGSRSRKRAGR